MRERQHFSSYTKKFEMIIGPKLDRVNRPLSSVGLHSFAFFSLTENSLPLGLFIKNNYDY